MALDLSAIKKYTVTQLASTVGDITEATVDNIASAIKTQIKTANTIDEMKEKYAKSGNIDDISNQITYLKNQGYTVDKIASMLNSPDSSITKSDIKKQVKSAMNTASGYVDGTDISYKKDNLMGLPFRYSTVADPRRRVYNNTFLADHSVISFMPGKPLYRKNNTSITGADSGNFFDDGTDESGFPTAFGVSDDSSEAEIISWLKGSAKASSNPKKAMDLRYYGWTSDYDTYYKYLNLALETVGYKMGISNVKPYSQYVQDSWTKRSISFYCTKNANVSESLSNEYGSSAIADSAKTVSDVAREAQFLFGLDDTTGLTISDDNKSILSDDYKNSLNMSGTGGDTGFFSSILSGATNALKSVTSGLTSAATGVQLYYPEIWKDSSFSRNYSVQFDFVSPYGDPEAIFEYVYLPFLTLYTLASPRQSGLNGYTGPFLLKADMPGYFTSDLAVISSMSWTKGGKDGLYNRDGLPLAMTVDITVKDLYPIVIMANKFSLLRMNTGFHSFLDNMAGLAMDRYDPIFDIQSELNAKLTYISPENTFDRAFQTAKGWTFRITHPNMS
jgi:hypothetical protein